MIQKYLIDFQRGNFASGAVDHLLEAAGQENVPVAVDEPFVSGPEPSFEAVVAIGASSSFVAHDDAWASNHDLSSLARRYGLAGRVNDGHLHANGHPD